MLEIAIPNLTEELQVVEKIATCGFFLGMGVKYGPPDFFLNRYPRAWTDIYEERNYFFGDPIVSWTFMREGFTRWSEQSLYDPRDIMSHAAEFGLKFGATFTTKVAKKKYFLSVARTDRELTDSEMVALASKLESWANAFSGLKFALTDLEIAALRVVGDGLLHRDAAAQLGISVTALKLRLSNAQNKLGVRNTTAAIKRATRMNLI